MPKNSWFEVDKEGLAKLLERKGGKAFVIFELLQNAWDEQSTTVSATLEMISGRPACNIVVVDDSPQGFRDLSHAFTLFADSYKKSDPSKRGRFDIGEKLVLACCEEARIISTTGSIIFNKDGERSTGRQKTATGTRFEGTLRMTRPEFEEVTSQINRLIPPSHISTTFNGNTIHSRTPIITFAARLPTEESDENGILRRRERDTVVSVYKPINGEEACIYEMGIPVVETGDKYHYDVQQKVPVNFERENVPPSYLRKLRTYVLNHTFSLIQGEEDANTTWVRDAIEDKECVPAAIKQIVTERFGEDAVIYDPSDPEGSKLSMSVGRTVIPGGAFSAGAWNNIKINSTVLPAGQVTPSPKPFSEFGRELKAIEPENWTVSMKLVAKYAKMLGLELMEKNIEVVIVNDSGWHFNAAYGPDLFLTLNVAQLGHAFFNTFPDETLTVDRLLIHEFGHQYSGDHLSSDYHRAICMLGAKLKKLALAKPDLFYNFSSI